MSHKPRLAWFTPLSRRSAISAFSLLVTRELSRTAEVDLWVPRNSDFHLATLPVHALSQDPRASREKMGEYDLTIYNMGNHFPFHGEIYPYLKSFPGVVILHDLVLHNFFYGAFIAARNDKAGYLALIERFYGRDCRTHTELAFEGKAPPVWGSDQVLRFPLFEPAVKGAYGVIVHSDWARARVRQAFGGPVEKIFLAYDCSRQTRKRLVPRDRGRLLVLSVGLVHPHKRIASVIRALGNNHDIAKAVEYVVIGATNDQRYFKECQFLIEKYGLENCVRFAGHVPDELLHAYLEEADICLNLRSPTTESGSASLAEAMLAGKAIVALNAGCFRDVPDDCAVRIDEANEQLELERALRHLIADGDARRMIARNAYQFAAQHFTAHAYVDKLLPFLDRVRGIMPLMRSVDRIGGALGEMAAAPGMHVHRAVTETFHELFGSGDTRRSSE